MKKDGGMRRGGDGEKRKQRDDTSKARHRKTTFNSNTLYEVAIGLAASDSAFDNRQRFSSLSRG